MSTRYAHAAAIPATQYHHLFFTLTNQLSFHGPLARPLADTDYMTYAYWVSETNLHAIETMAEYLGIELDDVPIPDPVLSPVSGPHEHPSRSLRSIKVDDSYVAYQVRIAFRLARYLERFEQIGAEIVDENRADVAALAPRSSSDWDESEAELERFVLADEGVHDVQLVHLFNRHSRRFKALMGPSVRRWCPPHDATARPFLARLTGRAYPIRTAIGDRSARRDQIEELIGGPRLSPGFGTRKNAPSPGRAFGAFSQFSEPIRTDTDRSGWRKGWDLNSRTLSRRTLSRRVPLAARAPFRRQLYRISRAPAQDSFVGIVGSYRRAAKNDSRSAADSSARTPWRVGKLWLSRGSVLTLYRLAVAPPFRSAAP